MLRFKDNMKNNRTADIQEIINRLGLSLEYDTIDDENGVVERATIKAIGPGTLIIALRSLMTGPGTIEIIVSNFIKAFAKGYDMGYSRGKAN